MRRSTTSSLSRRKPSAADKSRPATPARAQHGGIAGRLLAWIFGLLFACVLLSVFAVLALRWLNPFGSAYMWEKYSEAQAAQDRSYHADYRWVSLEHISPFAAIAVVASEDQQFPFHSGFDVNSIRESVRASEHGKRLRGASTITQQVAKNLFLWNGRSLARKGIEAWFTVLIEMLWPKERILEIYLNIIELGKGIYGVEAAAKRFYHKPAADLTSAEAATLAAVLPNPIRMHADNPSPYVQSRREAILGQMQALGGPGYLKALDKERHH
jgi:monofunctional glycosyltransferase